MFERILVPLNGLASAEAAVAPAAALARTHRAELHLVLVDGPSRQVPMSDEFAEVDLIGYRDRQMQPMAEQLRRDMGIAVTTAMLTGQIVAALEHYVSSVKIDLVTMATHGRVGWRRAWVGSVADELMHQITMPLLLVRAGADVTTGPRQFARILVALDGSDAARRALQAARAIARPGNSTLVLARVVAQIPMAVGTAAGAGVVLTDTDATQQAVDAAHEYLEQIADEVRAGDPMPVETVVELASGVTDVAPVGPVIVDLARRERIDLVALTSHDRGVSRLFVKSVADKVLQDTQCALLICHDRVVKVAPVAEQVRFAQAIVI